MKINFIKVLTFPIAVIGLLSSSFSLPSPIPTFTAASKTVSGMDASASQKYIAGSMQLNNNKFVLIAFNFSNNQICKSNEFDQISDVFINPQDKILARAKINGNWVFISFDPSGTAASQPVQPNQAAPSNQTIQSPQSFLDISNVWLNSTGNLTAVVKVSPDDAGFASFDCKTGFASLSIERYKEIQPIQLIKGDKLIAIVTTKENNKIFVTFDNNSKIVTPSGAFDSGVRQGGKEETSQDSTTSLVKNVFGEFLKGIGN